MAILHSLYCCSSNGSVWSDFQPLPGLVHESWGTGYPNFATSDLAEPRYSQAKGPRLPARTVSSVDKHGLVQHVSAPEVSATNELQRYGVVTSQAGTRSEPQRLRNWEKSAYSLITKASGRPVAPWGEMDLLDRQSWRQKRWASDPLTVAPTRNGCGLWSARSGLGCSRRPKYTRPQPSPIRR